MTASTVEIAIGRALFDSVRRAVVFLRRRATMTDAGGARYLADLRDKSPVFGTVGRILIEACPKQQTKQIDAYFSSPEFNAALRHVFAARVLYGPNFRAEANKSVAIIGAGLRMYIPNPSPRIKTVLGRLTEAVVDLVDEVVSDKKFDLLKYASEPAFQAFLHGQLTNLELVVNSAARAGDPREVVSWLDQYQRSATALYSRVRTPHWNDQVLAPIERIYVSARFRFMRELDPDDYRLAGAEEKWRARLRQMLNDLYPINPNDQASTDRRIAVQREAEATHDRLELPYSSLVLDRLVVLGDPGAGKTTLAQRVAFDLLSGRAPSPQLDHDARIPFIVTLRDFARIRDRSIAEHIGDHCANRFQARPPDGMIEFLFAIGRALVVFDGMDELPDTSMRTQVSDSIEAFAATYPNVGILVTSRLVGYEQAPLNEHTFTSVRILPFNELEVRSYVNTWFHLDQALPLNERHSVAEAFLRTTTSISDLRSNPLLLALLCNLYRATGYQELPRSRPAILEKCAMVLFDRWDRNRGIGNVRFEEEYAPTVAYLAYTMFTNPQYSGGMSEHDLVDNALQFLVPNRFHDEREGRLFCQLLIEHCRNRAWVFTDVGADPLGESIYQFTHRTFLEYFTAAHIVRRYRISDDIVPVLWRPVSTASWGLVPLLVLQILARSFDEDAGRAVSLLLDRMGQDPKSDAAIIRFAIEVMMAVPLPVVVVQRIARVVAELLSTKQSAGWALSRKEILGRMEEILPQNMAAFDDAALELGLIDLAEDLPPREEWTDVADSTLVRAIAYDEAAEKIFVRVIPHGLLIFEGCSEEVWKRFRVPGTSIGAYVQNVLALHPHTRY